MKTATQIFEELLDAYDGVQTDRIMATSTATVDEVEAQMEAHLAELRKYREDFREANEEGIMQALRTAQSFEDSRGAVEAPAEEAEARIPAAPQPAQVIDLMEALKASLEAEANRRYGVSPDATRANRESVADRSERLAERYTRDDGSSR